jgi:type III secretion system low calcium response chaperone LcrH/SycD
MVIKVNEKLQEAMNELGEKIMKQGMTGQEAAGLDPQYLESLYAQAYRLYNTGKYIDAAHLFRTLILMNSMEAKYILGLAACFHMLKEYKNAIETYTMCSVIDPQDPLPYYHSSDCFVQMKDYLSAMLCLELTINAIGNRPEYSKIKERATLSLEGLKKEETHEDFEKVESPKLEE